MINISTAEAKILTILPQVTMLAGEINSLGSYVVFDHLTINNALIDDVDYAFNLFIAIASQSKNKRLAYAPMDDALTALIAAYQIGQDVQIGNIKPFSIKGLIVYQIPLTVRGFKGEDYV